MRNQTYKPSYLLTLDLLQCLHYILKLKIWLVLFKGKVVLLRYLTLEEGEGAGLSTSGHEILLLLLSEPTSSSCKEIISGHLVCASPRARVELVATQSVLSLNLCS